MVKRENEISIYQAFSELIPRGLDIHESLPPKILTVAVPWMDQVLLGIAPEGIASPRGNRDEEAPPLIEHLVELLSHALDNHQTDRYDLGPRLGELATLAIKPWFLQPFEASPTRETIGYLGRGLDAVSAGGMKHLTPVQTDYLGDTFMYRYYELFHNPTRKHTVDRLVDPYQDDHDPNTPNIRRSMLQALARMNLSISPEERDGFFTTEMRDPQYLNAVFLSLDLNTQAQKLPQAMEVIYTSTHPDIEAVGLNILFSFLYDLQVEMEHGDPTPAFTNLRNHNSDFLRKLLIWISLPDSKLDTKFADVFGAIQGLVTE